MLLRNFLTMKSISKTSKIIIDPGHVGNSYFDFRYFKIDNIEFREGDFTFAWAQILQKMLLEKFNKIELTRVMGQPSVVISQDVLAFRKKELEDTIGYEASLKKFRVPVNFFPLHSPNEFFEAAIQNEADLLNRASVATNNNYDFCFSLHLNGDPTALKTAKNGICGFTNKLSIKHYMLFEKIIANIAKHTDLPILQIETLEEIASGVFVDESLTLLNNIGIPTLLIEGPFQNNPQELILLNNSFNAFSNDEEITGRLEQLSSAIVNSL
jgi:N-acetylmuramoyl-L-alanine amidase